MIKDANILLSFINMKLRDFYSSIDELCDDLDYSIEEINEILNEKGYYYDLKTNQYKLKD